MDSDRVLVLDQGRLTEYDTPEALLANKDSIFASLVGQAGLGGGENSRNGSKQASGAVSRATSVKEKEK
jgi:ABC-type proline/glycine betaine transport system ATPase subunit